ncbi:MAG: carboxypeptidase regulatory-like domain-containing protein, partial [Gemmatimonadetes bacterium]|nr:carboxypeptidase regulatory-like domain-containing protein [Gemmatimonadota bacterium]
MLIKRPTHLRSVIVGFAIMTLGLLPASPAKAQDRQFDVRGVVNGSDGAGLQGAMVVALTRADSTLTKYALSSGQGTFTLSRVPVGEYVLQVTSMGYQTFRRDFSVTSGDVDAGPVTLELAPVGMDTLFVNPE